MKNSSRPIVVVLLLLPALVIRLYKLGTIPTGLSAQEIRLGLILSNYLGNGVLNGFAVRVPFAIAGIFSIVLFYLVLLKYSKSFWTAVLGAIVLSITPWHIWESRIYSNSLLLFNLVLLVAYVIPLNFIKRSTVKISIGFLTLAIVLFGVSVFINRNATKVKVDEYRNITASVDYRSYIKLFTNKYIESYRFNQKRLFEGIDFGYYFFSGHPRERWGFEETQKVYIIFLPFLLFGISVHNRKIRFLLSSLFLVILSSYLFYKSRDSDMFFPVIGIISYLTASGLTELSKIKRAKYLLFIAAILLLYEFTVFITDYFIDFEDNLFSPRRAYYHDLVKSSSDLAINDKKVLVTDKLEDAEIYFRFYLKNKSLEKYEFRKYFIWSEPNKDMIFIDTIPLEDTPESQFFNKSVEKEKYINFLFKLNDKSRKRDIVIYTYDK